jgi:putative oxidoreductase
MSTSLLLELFAGFLAACVALWFVWIERRPATLPATEPPAEGRVPDWLRRYFLGRGAAANLGLLLLRLAIGTMMIHHGQDKLADPATFAATYVAPLHLPFPLFLAHVAGYAEVLGSWMVILGVLAPLGALALCGTMAVAAYHHILTAGLNIYVLELVVLYLGGSLALLLIGPGRFSFDAGIVAELATAEPPASAHGDGAPEGAAPGV